MPAVAHIPVELPRARWRMPALSTLLVASAVLVLSGLCVLLLAMEQGADSSGTRVVIGAPEFDEPAGVLLVSDSAAPLRAPITRLTGEQDSATSLADAPLAQAGAASARAGAASNAAGTRQSVSPSPTTGTGGGGGTRGGTDGSTGGGQTGAGGGGGGSDTGSGTGGGGAGTAPQPTTPAPPVGGGTPGPAQPNPPGARPGVPALPGVSVGPAPGGGVGVGATLGNGLPGANVGIGPSGVRVGLGLGGKASVRARAQLDAVRGGAAALPLPSASNAPAGVLGAGVDDVRDRLIEDAARAQSLLGEHSLGTMPPN